MIKEFNVTSGNLVVRLTQSPEELAQAQKLRYDMLILDYDASKQADGTDASEYDNFCDHLVAIDTDTNKVVGTYRLMSNINLPKGGSYVCETEFNVDNLKNCGDNILELGRAVVDKDYRNGVVIKLLWQGLHEYCKLNNIRFMFGTGSFHGVNADEYKNAFSWLNYEHKIDAEHDCFANNPKCELNILDLQDVDASVAKREMPPLIKSYITLGGKVGSGAYFDYDFNSTDVMIILDLNNINKPFAKRLFGWEYDND